MIRYKIEEICGDWAIYEVWETETEGGERCLLVLNSRSNAEYVKAILEHEARDPNAAVPYRPEVANMSDEEVLAINRLCCAGGNQCHACPFSGSESLEKTCFEVERRVNGLAERYLEWRKEDVVRCKDCEFAIEEDENVYTCEAYVGGYNSGQTFCSYGKRREGGAERYVEAAHSPSPADGGSSLPEGASGADADDTNVGRKREWISVDERLPDVYEDYLVVVKHKYEYEDEWEYDVDVGGPALGDDGYIDHFWETYHDWEVGEDCHITHWMPLPEPPMMKGGAG